MNCPFCKSPERDRQKFKTPTAEGCWIDFDCDAAGTIKKGGTFKTRGNRGIVCYERELARKDVWIDRALKFIKGTAGAYYKSDRKYFCNFCSTRKGKGHLPTCPVGQAQALLADMEAE